MLRKPRKSSWRTWQLSWGGVSRCRVADETDCGYKGSEGECLGKCHEAMEWPVLHLGLLVCRQPHSLCPTLPVFLWLPRTLRWWRASSYTLQEALGFPPGLNGTHLSVEVSFSDGALRSGL